MQEMLDEKMTEVRKRHRTLLIIWVVILCFITFFIALPVIIKVTAPSNTNQTLFMMLLGLSLMAIIASFILKSATLKRAAREQSLKRAASGYILSFALCESSVLFGVLASFMGFANYYYLFIAGPLCMLLHMPRRERLLAVTYGGAD